MRVVRAEGRGDGIVRSLHLTDSAFRAMIEESEQRLPNETGGILVGRMDADRAEVAIVVGPGSGAVHRRDYFRRDGDFSQRELEAIYARFGGQYDYVGEWHSHSLPAGPSPRDRKSMRWVAQNEHYDLDRPLLIVCQRTWRREWKPRGYQWFGGRLVGVPIVVVDTVEEGGESSR